MNNKDTLNTDALSEQKKLFFKQALYDWGLSSGRKNLPWQVKDPYCVWVSEIMLQQTQVAAVREYYQRFLTVFPTVDALASASEQEVLAQWAGLGYYARGRNLLKAAQYIVKNLNREFPKTRESLQTLPGVGKSTAAAISSICFGESVSILDANALRVIARYSGFKEQIGIAKNLNKLWGVADRMVGKNPALHTQTLMDLGALVCTAKKPQCSRCPLETECIAKKEQLMEQIPNKKKVLSVRRQVEEHWVLITDGSKVLLAEGRNVGSSKTLWKGLLTLPLKEQLGDLLGNGVLEPLKDASVHKFSHFDLKFNVSFCVISTKLLNVVAQEIGGLICDLNFDRLNAPKPVLESLEIFKEKQLKEQACSNIMII